MTCANAPSLLCKGWKSPITPTAGWTNSLPEKPAVCSSPDTLLLDEPTTSLDLPALREVRTQLRKLAAEGVGLLLITHHLDDIIPEIDRVVLLRDGRVAFDGPKEEVLTSERLSQTFAIPLEVVTRDGYYHAW